MSYIFKCPNCGEKRELNYKAFWYAKTHSRYCKKCAPKNLVGLKKGQGWNKGLKKSGMSGKKQSEKQKEMMRERNKNDNPAKRPEVREKMRSIALNRKVHPNTGRHWKVKDTSNFGKSGEKHWKWIIDRTKIKQGNIEKRSPRYKEWRKSVCDRDGWKCKINNCDCNGRLEVHHILGFTEYPELRYDINNGITLCHYHHPRKVKEVKSLIPIFKELITIKAKINY